MYVSSPVKCLLLIIISWALSVSFSLEIETIQANIDGMYEIINGDLYKRDRTFGTATDGRTEFRSTTPHTSGLHSLSSETSTQRQKDVWTAIHNFELKKTSSLFDQG